MCQAKKKEVVLKAIHVKKYIRLKEADIKRAPKLSDGGYVWAG